MDETKLDIIYKLHLQVLIIYSSLAGINQTNGPYYAGSASVVPADSDSVVPADSVSVVPAAV